MHFQHVLVDVVTVGAEQHLVAPAGVRTRPRLGRSRGSFCLASWSSLALILGWALTLLLCGSSILPAPQVRALPSRPTNTADSSEAVEDGVPVSEEGDEGVVEVRRSADMVDRECELRGGEKGRMKSDKSADMGSSGHCGGSETESGVSVKHGSSVVSDPCCVR